MGSIATEAGGLKSQTVFQRSPPRAALLPVVQGSALCLQVMCEEPWPEQNHAAILLQCLEAFASFGLSSRPRGQDHYSCGSLSGRVSWSGLAGYSRESRRRTDATG